MEVCPTNIIGVNFRGEVDFISERASICLHCGQCMAICSTQAIAIEGLSYNNNVIDLPENRVDYHNFIDFLANRRSVRNFKKKPVSTLMIDKILDSIAFAPFGAAPEKTEITVVNKRSTIEAALPFIEKFLDDIVKWIDNPVTSFIIKQKKGAETFNTIKNHLYPISKLDNYKLKHGDRITRGAPAIFVFHALKGAEEHTNNSLIYATYAMLTAHSLGLGATMIGIVPAAINKVPEVRSIFEIPKENEAVISLIVGHPIYKYRRAIKRQPQIIHKIM